MEIYIWIILIVILGAFSQSSSGFGFSIITMSLFPLFFSVINSMVLVAFTNIIAVTFIVIKYFKYVKFKLLMIPAALTLLTTYIGLMNLVSIDNSSIIKILGISLILLSIYFFFFANKIQIPANQFTAAVVGITAGLMNGFLAIPGPPIVLYYSAALKDKKEYMATVQFLFLMSNILKIYFFTINYGVSSEIAKYIPFMIIAAIFGTFIGHNAFKKLSSDSLRKVIYVIMVISGVKYLCF